MRRIVLIFSLLIFVRSAFGQAPGTGFPPFGSFQGGGFDSVNLQNLNVNFMVPIVSHPGRGPGFQYNLTYSSLIYSYDPAAQTPAWTAGGSWGWGQNGATGTLQSQTSTFTCVSTPTTWHHNYVYIDPGGTPHPLPISYSEGSCNLNQNWTGYATDASGYFADISAPGHLNPIIRGPDGTKLNYTSVSTNPNLMLTDPNGNQLVSTVNTSTGETDWIDTLGQTVLKIVSTANGTTGENDYSRLAVDGTYQTFRFKWQTTPVKTAFGCANIVDLTNNSALLVAEIDLPNNQKYTFTYEPTPGQTGYVTGRIQQVTLPTGGTITYNYNGANDGLDCTDGSVLGLTRTISDGTTSAVWVYSRVPSGTSGGTTTITAPPLPYDSAGNQTAVTFDTNGHETNRLIYQGGTNGTLLRTVNATWASNNTPATRTVVLEDGATQSEIETAYDSNGNLQTMKEHDWHSGGPGTILRTTNFVYLGGSAYTGLNIINRVQTKTVADSTGATKYRMDIGYDGAGLVNSKCVTGAPGHDDTNYGCSFTTRGSPTSVTTYADAATPSGGITKNYNYDSVGNLVLAQLDCCQQKQWNFSSVTQYAFPDTIVSGSGSTQLTTGATYYLTTGQISTSTDENNQLTTYTYVDPGNLDRLTKITRSDGTSVTSAYADSLRTVTVTTPITSTTALQSITAFDPLGRQLTSTVEDGSNNTYSIVQSQYDALNRPYKSSNPYTSSAQYWTTTQFDALGRAVKVTMPDANQTTYSYATTMTTVTDPTGKQRASKSDGLGRMIEVDEPGIASGASPTQATGSVSISGALQSIGGTVATGSVGSVSINGAEKSAQTAPATSGSGSVTISGVERSRIINACPPRSCPTTIYDVGTVSITVNGVINSFTYNNAYTASTIASGLASAINANSNINTLVSASASSGTVTIIARQTGSQTNYSLSAASATSDTTLFSGTSFPATASGSTLTGGSNAQITYDSGIVSVTVNGGSPTSVSYNSASTTSSIASQLATALASSSLVSASASGNVITLSSKTTGAATNYSLSVSSQSNNSSLFNPPSFTESPSGSTMTGGSNGTATQYDSGTVWITVGGSAATVNYGQGSTPSSVASALATALTGSAVTATASNSTVNLTSVMAGSAANSITLSAGSATGQPGNFSQPSYQTGTSGATLTGGSDPTLSLSTPAITAYSYTVVGSLTSVTQGAQTRSYNYDGMGRLMSSSTPEGGTVQIQYNNFSLVTQRTDARGVVTAYQYDSLNRPMGASYTIPNGSGVAAMPSSCTPGGGTPANVCWTYGSSASQNNNGRLLTMTDSLGSETYSYDPHLPLTTQVQKVVSGTTYATSYTYNLAGELTSLVYPSGRVVKQSYDAIGRLCEIAPATTGCSTAMAPWATGFGYNTASQVTGFRYGNGVNAAFGFSPDRLQLTSLNYAKGTTSLFGLNYAYSQNGGNNGEITNITEPADAGQSVNYSYDVLGRLSTAVSVGSVNFSKWGLSFTYDRYGNRTAEIPTAGTAMPSSSVAVDATTNHINSGGYAYDLSGNMTNDGINTMIYDGENRVTSTTGGSGSGSYSYDGNGLRVQKVAGGTTTLYVFSGSKVIAEYDNGVAVGSPSREYIYSGNVMLAKIEGGITNYYHSDHLSVRLTTDSNGNLLGQLGHYPFGETWYETGTTTKFKFTTYQRDGESGNDFAMARYNVNRLGRFATPDPMAGSSSSPQSLNRYAYAANDPVDLADPSGAAIWPGMQGLRNLGFFSYDPFGGGWNEFDIFEDHSSYRSWDTAFTRNEAFSIAEFTVMNWNLINAFGGPAQPPEPRGYKKCIEAALREVLASGETPNESNPYGTLVGGTVMSAHDPFQIFVGQSNVHLNLSSVTGQPGMFVRVHNGDSPRIWSSAFGRYQITYTTAKNFGFTDFSPAGQDAAATTMLNFYDAVQPAVQGNFQQAVWNMWPWASMPDSPLPGGKISMQAAFGIFQNALNTRPECQ
jgi:RHS repeat-associated protein